MTTVSHITASTVIVQLHFNLYHIYAFWYGCFAHLNICLGFSIFVTLQSHIWLHIEFISSTKTLLQNFTEFEVCHVSLYISVIIDHNVFHSVGIVGTGAVVL
ncbi:MAG: hypothetical protein B6229_00590 [Spirochaetaceae bacterium 4572_7]|nr:MAG: hypothetical protein B6229_00590 [Spirochaetaceae bacterium 4572_7]